VKIIEPDDVASAIVAAVEQPRFKVWVPPVLGAALEGHGPPAAGGCATASAGSSRPTSLLARADRASRADYERRIAGSPSAALRGAGGQGPHR